MNSETVVLHAAKKMCLVLFFWYVFILRSAVSAQTVAETIRHEVIQMRTADGIEFGIWPAQPEKPAPTLIVLASTIQATLGQAYFRQSGNLLAEHGFLCVTIDLPCHGSQKRPEEPDGIEGWRYRCDHQENFITDLNQRLSAVLSHLIEQKLTDPERIAVCGTSRGGYSALQFTASDSRVRCVAAFAPVTDLSKLSEFQGSENNPLVQSLSLENIADRLTDRGVWIIIGDRDARVSTESAVDFARKVTEKSLAAKLSPRLDLHVVAEPKGHTTPAGAPEMAAAWILKESGVHSGR
jgi:dienelactone hydrolase